MPSDEPERAGERVIRDPDPADAFWAASSLTRATAPAFGLRLEAFEPGDDVGPHPLLAGGAVQGLRPADDRFQRRLAARTSCRIFGHAPIPQRQVELVLASMGPTPDGRRLVPEAGGLDVVHIYALMRRVDGPLDGAIVRYDHRRHAVQSVAPVPSDDEVREVLLIEADVLPQVVLVFVLHLSEAERKYGARSVRFGMQQVGHAAQNAGLRVAHEGLAGYLLGGGLDREVLALLRIGHVPGVRYGGAYAFGR